jgi:hypothetical protein
MANKLNPNQQLSVNDTLSANNAKTTLIMQSDGNLVLYLSGTTNALWDTGTFGKPVTHAIMQSDVNFV